MADFDPTEYQTTDSEAGVHSELLQGAMNSETASHQKNIDAINKELSRSRSDRQRDILSEELRKETALLRDQSGIESRARQQMKYDFPTTTSAASPATISGQDFVDIITNPGVGPASKLNAQAAAWNTPGLKDQLADRMGRLNESANLAEGAIGSNVKQLTELLGARGTLIQQNAEYQVDALRAKQLQAEKGAATYTQYLTQAGLNLDDPGQLINTKAADQVRLDGELIRAKQDIAAKQNQSFFDDPMSWLLGQIELPSAIQKHNQLAGVYNQNEEFLKTQNELAKLARDSNLGKNAAMTNAESQALINTTLLKAQEDKIKLQEDAANLGIKSTEAIQKIQQTATGQLGAAIRHDDEQEARAFVREDAKYTSAERLKFARNRDEAERAAADEKARLVGEKLRRDQKYAAVGAAAKINLQSEEEFKLLNKKLQAQLQPLIDSVDENGNITSFGTNPTDVVNNVAGLKNLNLSAEQKQMFAATRAMVEENRVALEHQGSKGEVLVDQINKNVKKRMTDWQADPGAEGSGPKLPQTGEIWRAFNAPLLTMVADKPSLAGNQFATEVTLLKAAVPGQEITPGMVLTSLAVKLGAGNTADITPVAKQVAEFYQYVINNNNAILDPAKFGLPEQSTYNQRLPTGIFGSNQMYDLASIKGATLALSALIRRNAAAGSSLDLTGQYP